MRQRYKPLEDNLEALIKYAKVGDTEAFEKESSKFYENMGKLVYLLGKSSDKTNANQLVLHYQTEYNQIKLLWKKK